MLAAMLAMPPAIQTRSGRRTAALANIDALPRSSSKTAIRLPFTIGTIRRRMPIANTRPTIYHAEANSIARLPTDPSKLAAALPSKHKAIRAYARQML